jgi:D-alanyl-D-alanine dipeptidase
MNDVPATPPAAFTTDDYVARMRRVVADATDAGLDGLLITPGPDLVWLSGYQPTAITERLTVLVLAPGEEPTLLVPTLERPDAEGAAGAPGLSIVDWADGEDPFARASAFIRADATMGIADSAWAMHLLGLQDALPGSSYRSLTQCLPMLRAVKDADELARLAAAGAAADATYEQILGGPVRRPEGDRRRGGPGPFSAGLRARAGGLHRGRLGSERRQPAPRGG